MEQKELEKEKDISDQAAKIFEVIEQKKGMNHPLSVFKKLIKEKLQPLDAFNIQIAGTNGKGSVSKWLSLLFEKKGLKTGLFSSPHMLSHTERIQISNKPISEKEFIEIYKQYESLFEQESFTMFEVDLWIALAYFEREKVDIALWEAGLGGRLDATSTLDRDMAILTDIGLDHMELLGESLEKIALEKAGLMQDGNPEVIYSTSSNAIDESVYKVLTQKAKENCSKLFFMDLDGLYSDVQTDQRPGSGFDLTRFSWIDIVNRDKEKIKEKEKDKDKDRARIRDVRQFKSLEEVVQLLEQLSCSESLSAKAKRNLQGYQKRNFLLACSIFFDLGYRLNLKEMEEVVEKFSWPGRLVFLQEEPLLLLDGAHNEPAIEALVDTIRQIDLDIKKVYFSVLKDKSKEKMISILLKGLDLDSSRLVLVDFQAQRQADLQELAKRYDLKVIDLQTCLDEIFPARVNTLCCGSLYFIARLLEAAQSCSI